MFDITLKRVGQKFSIANKEELVALLMHFGVEWNVSYEDELALKEHLIVSFPAKRIADFPFQNDTISCVITFVRTEIVVHFLPEDLRNYVALLTALEKDVSLGLIIIEELILVQVVQEFEDCAVFSVQAFLSALLPDMNIVSYDVHKHGTEYHLFLADASDSRLVGYTENHVKDFLYKGGKVYFSPYHPNENLAHYCFLFSLKQGKYMYKLENILQERIQEYTSPSLSSDEDKIIFPQEQKMADLGYYPLHLQ